MALTMESLRQTQVAFDGVAAEYDASNRANPILRAMRTRALERLRREVPPGAHLLELGCGPGTDSRALTAAGYDVTAIDVSPAMVAEARDRAQAGEGQARLQVRQLGIHEVERLAPVVFDAAFSNFGPFNCVPDLPDAARQLAARLRPGGVLVASVIGRVCPWEIALYLSRGQWRRATIRFSREAVPVPLAGGTVWTHYYSPREFSRVFEAAGFRCTTLQALGLCGPPPYLGAFAARHPDLAEALQGLDDLVGAWPGLRNWGDHFLVTLRKH